MTQLTSEKRFPFKRLSTILRRNASCTTAESAIHLARTRLYGMEITIVGYSDKYQAIGSHRVDRIAACPCILDKSAVPQPVGFDVSKYIKTTFRMYDAPRVEVELLCDNSVMDAIIDCFGPDVHTYAGDLQNFRVIEEVAVGKVFFNWIFGFEGKVQIKGPESVKEQYKKMVLTAMSLV